MQSSFFLKRGISFAVSLLLALIVEYYFSFSHEYLVVITAVFVMFSQIGNVVMQGLQRLLLVVLLVILFTWIFNRSGNLYPRIYDVAMGGAIGIAVNLFILPRKADKEFRTAILPLLRAYENYFNAIAPPIMQTSNAIS